MNNRIKQMITDRGMFHDSELYEIAESVVRECAEVVAKFAKECCREGESPDYGYERVIKEHFGVKE
jgi:hypothetical protein